MSIHTDLAAERRATIKAAAIHSASEYLNRIHANILDAENIAPGALKARITTIEHEIAALRTDIGEGKF